MKIYTKIVLGLAFITGCAAVAVPNIYNSKINQFIYTSQKNLEINGMTSEIKNSSDTYFAVQREYTVTIQDSSVLLNNIGTQIDSKVFKDIQELLDDTKFSFLLNFPKYPSSQKDAVKVSLSELSQNVQNVLNRDKIGKEIIRFVNDKGVQLNLSLDNYKIKEAKLKDVDLNINDKDKNLKQNIKNLVITFDSLKKYNLNIDILSASAKDKSFNAGVKISSYKYNMDKKDNFNAQDNMFIKNISFNYLENSPKKGNAAFNIKDIKANSSIFTENELVSASSKLGVKTIDIKIKNETLEFNNISTKLSINDLNKKLIENIVTAIENGTFFKKNGVDQNIQEFVHEGFLLNLEKFEVGNSKINFANNKFELGKLHLDSGLKINSNIIDLNAKPTLEWLTPISSTLNLEMSKKDILSLMSKLRVPNKFLEFIKIDNEKASINAEFKSKELFVNNKKVL